MPKRWVFLGVGSGVRCVSPKGIRRPLFSGWCFQNVSNIFLNPYFLGEDSQPILRIIFFQRGGLETTNYVVLFRFLKDRLIQLNPYISDGGGLRLGVGGWSVYYLEHPTCSSFRMSENSDSEYWTKYLDFQGICKISTFWHFFGEKVQLLYIWNIQVCYMVCNILNHQRRSSKCVNWWLVCICWRCFWVNSTRWDISTWNLQLETWSLVYSCGATLPNQPRWSGIW